LELVFRPVFKTGIGRITPSVAGSIPAPSDWHYGSAGILGLYRGNFFGHKEIHMVRKFKICDGKMKEQPDEEGPVFIYINPTPEECKQLIDQYKIDEHTLQSSLDPNELARMEFEPEHSALIIKRPKRYNAKDNFFFKVESVGLFIFSDKIIITISEDVPIFDGRLFSSVSSVQELALKLIHRSVFHFEEHLKVISMVSDELEGEINTSVSNRQLLSMFTLEKSLVFYLDAISSNGRVVDKIKANSARLRLTPFNMEFLDDLAIENGQCLGMAQNYSQVLASLMDARASVISNNLNYMMKNLNALVIAVSVPSFFAGVGGMSEFSNMVGFKNWKLAYPLFILSMVGVGVITFILIKITERYWKT
jgi:magnesium transporter